MKQPKKLTPPVKDTRKSIFVEIIQSCTRDYHSGEQYGEWETEYDNTVTKISRNKDLLQNWNFEECKVPDEVYDAPFLYLVVVTYSTGDTFGRSSGNTAIAYITEDPEEAVKIRDDLNLGKNPSNDAKCPKGYCPWDGYFESMDDVSIIFLPVMG
jgi:hypothetical protein